MLLQNLPGVILRHILNGQNSWCAIELWKCGNRALNARLANKGITCIELSDPFTSSTSRWPRCLSFFNLEHLSVQRRNGPLGSPAVLRSELKKLSDSLITLDIAGFGLLEALFPIPNLQPKTLASDDSDDLEPLSKRPKSMENLADDQNHTIMWNWDTSWPHMERLIIFEPSKKEHLQPSTFALLPRSLTLFECTSVAVLLKEDFGSLPDGLNTLRLPVQSIGPRGLLTLPKSLTSLQGMGIKAILHWFKHPESLPLMRLENLQHQHELEDMFPIPPGDRFARSLTHYKAWFTAIDHLLTQLPTSLTSLSLHGALLSPHIVPALPRALQYLEINEISWRNLRMNEWPQNLQELVVCKFGKFGYNCFSLLPRSLKILKFTEDGDDRLAMNLTKLLTESPPNTELLPSIGRRCLDLERNRWNLEKSRILREGRNCEPYIARVENGDLFGLPLGLTKIMCEPLLLTLHNHLLPPRMESYYFDLAVDDPNGFDNLPPSDNFFPAINLHTMSTLDWLAPGIGDLDPTSTLLYNSNFSSLHIRSVCRPLIPDSLYQQVLPRTLTYLELARAEVYGFEHLPPQLRTLILRNCTFVLDNDWVRQLPRSLTELDLPKDRKINGFSIAQLPPKLRRLKAVFSSVTPADALNLPQTLEMITMEFKNSIIEALMHLCRPLWRIREYSTEYLLSELSNPSRLFLERNDDIHPITSRRFTCK